MLDESESAKVICYDLFCGQFWGSYRDTDGAWRSPFVEEGWCVIGFDLVDVSQEFGAAMPLPEACELRIRNVLEIHGSELADADLILASPPCTEPSYRAMPWKRAKALNAAGPPVNFIRLFEACFRIQREASEAKGEHVPLIVENVVGAQRWVGRAAWHFGSYYLWGDVPALMPPTLRNVMKEGVTHRSDGSTNFHGYKSQGLNWCDRSKRGQDFTRVAGAQHTKNDGSGWRDNGCLVSCNRLVPDGVKGFTPNGERLGKNTLGRKWGSKSAKRKLASAMIAKIPYPLALHLARVMKPAHSMRKMEQ